MLPSQIEKIVMNQVLRNRQHRLTGHQYHRADISLLTGHHIYQKVAEGRFP